ncbi:hypothetical protein L4C34_04965 [Vibrio profundum]|uniref:LA_2272 family surface repeat-containing protein n=1 Tax=Vibrio profundum TaxID=2910247 RepID=UPI003D11D135
MKIKFAFILILSILSSSAMAETQSLQASLPNGNYPKGDVKGARFTFIYGQTYKVSGANFTLFGISDVDHFTGAELALLGANRNRVEMQGFQFGVANWNDVKATGASLGMFNYTGEFYTGAQLGFVNYNHGLMKGAQLGLVNFANHLTGLQFGIVNATNRIDSGVQIGLINYDKSGTLLGKNIPVLPIINARF